MFDWFKKKDETELFTPKQRTIFRYWDGVKTRSVDPLVLYRKVMDIAPELSIDIKVANSVSKDAGKAYSAVVDKLQKIFEVGSYEQGGLTEMELSVLFDQFMLFCESIKKKSKPSPTSPSVTPEVSDS